MDRVADLYAVFHHPEDPAPWAEPLFWSDHYRCLIAVDRVGGLTAIVDGKAYAVDRGVSEIGLEVAELDVECPLIACDVHLVCVAERGRLPSDLLQPITMHRLRSIAAGEANVWGGGRGA